MTEIQICTWDKKPCYVSVDTDDAHWRCGTIQCGRNKEARITEQQDTVRVLRLIEYVGPRNKIEAQIEQSMRAGTHAFPNGVTIRIATLGDFPEILERSDAD